MARGTDRRVRRFSAAVRVAQTWDGLGVPAGHHTREEACPVEQMQPGYLCEQCLDAPAVAVVPAP